MAGVQARGRIVVPSPHLLGNAVGSWSVSDPELGSLSPKQGIGWRTAMTAGPARVFGRHGQRGVGGGNPAEFALLHRRRTRGEEVELLDIRRPPDLTLGCLRRIRAIGRAGHGRSEPHGASVSVGIAFFNSSTACEVTAVYITDSFLKFFRPLRWTSPASVTFVW